VLRAAPFAWAAAPVRHLGTQLGAGFIAVGFLAAPRLLPGV